MQRVQPEPDDRRRVAGKQARDQLAEVDVLERSGGVGQELSGAALALADDRRRAHRRRDR